MLFRKFLFVLISLMCPAALASNWYSSAEASFTPSVNSTLNNSAALHILAARICKDIVFGGKSRALSTFRVVDNVLQFDSDAVLSFNFRGVSYQVTILEVRYCPLYYSSALSFDAQADLFITELVYIRLKDVNSTINWCMPLSMTYKVNAATLNTINGATVAFYPIQDFSEYPYAVGFLTNDQSANPAFVYWSYYSKNIPVDSTLISVYATNLQSANAGLQIPASWVRVWHNAFASYFSMIGSDWLIQNQGWSLYEGNVSIFDNTSAEPYTSFPDTYLLLSPMVLANYYSNDYDQGGQFDFSEWLLGNDMKNPQDDNPNMSETLGDLIAVNFPAVPGESNIEDIAESYIEEIPTADDAPNFVEGLKSELESELQSNDGYSLLRALINPNGFDTSAQMPHYTIPFSISLESFGWQLPDIDIDFNRIKLWSAMWTWFQLLRSIMVLVLFVMTFLACYDVYEKSLAYSA